VVNFPLFLSYHRLRSPPSSRHPVLCGTAALQRIFVVSDVKSLAAQLIDSGRAFRTVFYERRGIDARSEQPDALSLSRILSLDTKNVVLICLCSVGNTTSAQIGDAIRRFDERLPAFLLSFASIEGLEQHGDLDLVTQSLRKDRNDCCGSNPTRNEEPLAQLGIRRPLLPLSRNRPEKARQRQSDSSHHLYFSPLILNTNLHPRQRSSETKSKLMTTRQDSGFFLVCGTLSHRPH
jgi:hypothetical protein